MCDVELKRRQIADTLHSSTVMVQTVKLLSGKAKSLDQAHVSFWDITFSCFRTIQHSDGMCICELSSFYLLSLEDNTQILNK